MNKMYINSGDLKSITYNEETSTLEVEYMNKEIFRYNSVPNDIYKNMLNASSKSRFFDDNIKNAFTSEKIA
jgi:hypothetical protein